MVVPSPANSNGKRKRNKNAHQSNHYKATHHSGSKADRKSGGKAGKGNKSINKLIHFGQTGPHLAQFKRQQELKKAKRANKGPNKQHYQPQLRQHQQQHQHRSSGKKYSGRRRQHHHRDVESSLGQSAQDYSGTESPSSLYSQSDDDDNNSDYDGHQDRSDFTSDSQFSPAHDNASSRHLPQQSLKRLQHSHHGAKKYTLDDHLPIYQQSGRTTTNFERYLSHAAVDEVESFTSSVTSSAPTSRSSSPGPSSTSTTAITKGLSRQARRHEERERARIQRRLQLEQAKQNRQPLFEEYKEGDLELFEERARLRNKLRKQEALLRQNPGRAKEILRQQQQQAGEEIIYVQPNAPVNNKKKSKRERQQQNLQQLKQHNSSSDSLVSTTTDTLMATQHARSKSRSPPSDMEVSSGSGSPSPPPASLPPAVEEDDLQTGADYIAFDLSDDESNPTLQQNQSITTPSSVAAGMKRKRDVVGDDDGSDAEGATGPPPNCPWMGHRRYSRMKTVPVMLTQELKDFVAYISPTREEHQVRKYVFMRIERAVKQLWPQASLHMFGSFETMLYLPSSDLDMVVKFPWDYRPDYLHQLARRLRMEKISSQLQSVTKARVPIIKMRESLTNLAVDISFNIDNGLQSAIMVKRFLEVAPGLKPLTMLIKHFLMLKDFNEPYTGGLGSYTTMIMILSFLQQHEKIRSGEINAEDNLGPLLIEFFELYGFKFNYDRVGISVVGRGRYLPKPTSAHKGGPGGRFGGGGGRFRSEEVLIYCEDPNDESNDTGRPSYKMRQIREVFAGAHAELSRRVQQRHMELFGRFEGGHSSSASHVRFDNKNQVAADSREKSHGLHREREQEKSLIHGVLSIPHQVAQNRQQLENVFYRGVFQDMFGHPRGLEGLDRIEAEEEARRRAAGPKNDGRHRPRNGSSAPSQSQHQRFVDASDTSDEDNEVIVVSDEEVPDDEYERAFEDMLSEARNDLGFYEEGSEEMMANVNPANVASSASSIQLPQIIGISPSSSSAVAASSSRQPRSQAAPPSQLRAQTGTAKSGTSVATVATATVVNPLGMTKNQRRKIRRARQKSDAALAAKTASAEAPTQ